MSPSAARPAARPADQTAEPGRLRALFDAAVSGGNIIVPVVCAAGCLVTDLIAIYWAGTVWNLPRTLFNAGLLAWAMSINADVFLPIAAAILTPGTLILAGLCLAQGLAGNFLTAMFVVVVLTAIFAAVNALVAGGAVPLARYRKLEKQYTDEREDRYQLLLQFSLLGCLTDMDRVFDQAFQILQKYFRVQQAVIYLANYTSNELRPARTIGYSSNSLDGLVIRVPPNFWELSEYDPEKGMTNIIYGRAQLPTLRAILPSCSLDSLMALPLTVKGRIVGLMNVVRQDSDEVRTENRSLLGTFGYVLASALNNCRSHETAISERDQAIRTSAEFQKKQQDLKAAFGRYVSPDVVAELEQDPTGAAVGGRRQKVTIMVADLRGFTAMTTVLQLEDLVRILNGWFERASQIILRNHGTIDKFMGDGIMVLFGAPIAKPDDTMRAAYTAVRLQEVFLEFKQEFAPLIKGHTLGLGISITTGDVVVGNFGSSRRMEYTAIGDAVNLAARFEKLAANGEIVADAGTFAQLQNRFDYRVEKNVQVKGKEPLDVYRLTGLKKQQAK
ncbi:MAG TPA: adenylate/guanylate cyclase domain-containing protein [Candidatus Ozemobacteraceae bacterium]